jgi:hypothetical protein
MRAGQSAEDQQKKDDIDLIVTRTTDPESGVQKAAIEALRAEIKGSKRSVPSLLPSLLVSTL